MVSAAPDHTSTDPPAIELNAVSVDGVPTGTGRRRVLDEVTFTVRSRTVVALYGASGSGKTTVLRAIAGAVRPTSGTVRLGGQAMNAATIDAVRRRIAWIGQEPTLGADDARGALLLPFTYRVNRERHPGDAEVARALAKVGLPPEILDQQTATLSGGERQRLVVARALLLGVSVFLADEPTSALDADSRARVIDALAAGGHTVLVATHDRDWIDRCAAFLRLEAGRLASIDSSPDVTVFARSP